MNPICWLMKRRLGAYSDGELGPAARVKIEAHAERCDGCAAALAGLADLRAALAVPAPEPAEAVWEAFWPQVRGRLAASPPPEPESRWRWVWGPVAGHPRLALGSALAAAALAILAVVAPWQRVEPPTRVPVVQAPAVAPSASGEGASIQQVLVQSVETADPQSSVMVFTNPESEVTVVWVFGLPRTEI